MRPVLLPMPVVLALTGVLLLAACDGGGEGAEPVGAGSGPTPRAEGGPVHGIMDGHPDPRVARLLLPRLKGVTFRGAPLVTNEEGFRGPPVTRPKPADTVRVVVLGDSFAFGWGVAEHERFGDVLARLLESRATAQDMAVEVVVFAVPSWNLVASTTYLRRQLDLVEPDLVVLQLYSNDLDDMAGVRGFGELSTWSVGHRERADVVVHSNHPVVTFGSGPGPLVYGLDHEGRERWEVALAEVGRLQGWLAARGGSLRVLMHMGRLNAVARQWLSRALPREAFVYVDPAFAGEPDFHLRGTDPHWNAAGHRLVAELLLGTAARDGWLPALGLRQSRAGRDAILRLDVPGRQLAGRPVDLEALPGRLGLGGRVAVDGPGEIVNGRQVHGGLDARGRLSPWSAFVLALEGASALELEVSGLDREALGEVSVSVEVDGQRLGVLAVPGPGSVTRRWSLPADLAGRSALTVRLLADDFAYAPDDLRHAVSLRLGSVALVR